MEKRVHVAERALKMASRDRTSGPVTGGRDEHTTRWATGSGVPKASGQTIIVDEAMTTHGTATNA